jgi:hypothetical protein
VHTLGIASAHGALVRERMIEARQTDDREGLGHGFSTARAGTLLDLDLDLTDGLGGRRPERILSVF